MRSTSNTPDSRPVPPSPSTHSADVTARTRPPLSFKSLVVFIVQAVFCFSLMIAAVYNLTSDSNNKPLWSSLLSGSLGYMLPAPRVKRDKKQCHTAWVVDQPL